MFYLLNQSQPSGDFFVLVAIFGIIGFVFLLKKEEAKKKAKNPEVVVIRETWIEDPWH